MNNTDWSAGAAWMRGKLMPVAQACIPVTDWGLTHSDITYDVVHVWQGRFFRLDDHLTRFEQSLLKLRLSVDQSRDDMRGILHQIVARAALQDAYVSFVVSRGQPAVAGSRDPRDCINHFYAWCVPFVWVFGEQALQQGAQLYISDTVQRISANAVDPTAKNYHWGDFTQALITAKDHGFDNTLLLDQHGNINEGPGFNVFLIKDGVITTPRSGVLEGITRKVTIELCVRENLQLRQQDVSLAQLLDADEIFVTTTAGGIVPVTRINNRVFSNGAAGEQTLVLQQLYWQWHRDSTMSEVVNYTV